MTSKTTIFYGRGHGMRIETDRIVLREFQLSDLEDVHCYAKEMDVVKYMSWGPNTEEDTISFIKDAIYKKDKEPRLVYEMAIIDKVSNALVGGVGLYILSVDNKIGEIGYSLNPKYWNMSYASEAAKAMIDFGFNSLKLHRIEARCDIRNIASSRVMEKSGMKREGIIREHIFLRGSWRNSYQYSIIEDDITK